MRSLVFLLATLLATLVAPRAGATDGDILPGFGTDAEFPGFGFYLNPNGAPNFSLDIARALLPRPDGKLWLVGRMRGPNSVYRISLYRLGANGYPDTDFGDLGLRTIVGPCPGFYVGDAALDRHGRILVATQDCDDFHVYRFLDNGDLDASFGAGGGVTIAFDLGNGNKDHAQYIIAMPDDGFVVAGVAAAAGGNHLALARHDADGVPVGSFGIGGRLDIGFEWRVSQVRGVNGLHLTRDGRIVVAGQISETDQAASDNKQYVVRLLGNGAYDPSFGSVSPGVSKVNLKSPLGVPESPHTSASMLEPDGSLVQVGYVVSPNPDSSLDMFLLRWRPDGQLDTSIGAHGSRIYALDFAGPNPPPGTSNSDSARAILRQGNGRYIVLGSGQLGPSFATTVMRLRPDFSLDPTFGNGGTVQHLVQVATNGDHGLSTSFGLVQPGRILAGGVAFTGVNGRVQTVFQMENDLLFADGLD